MSIEAEARNLDDNAPFAKLAQSAKYRNANDSLEAIQADIKRSLNELIDHQRRLVAYAEGLKTAVDAQLRLAG